MKWWQQLIAHNQWSYDAAQPPLVYTGKVGGKTRRIVSVATMEGVWFAFDAKTGQPFYQRVKVIDRVEHPALRPGQPVTIFPSSLGGLNYSPAAYDPTTNYVFNAAAETAAVLIQQKLTPTQKKRKLRPRRRLPRPAERQLRHRRSRLARPRLDQRDRRRHRQARLEVRRRRSRSAAASRRPPAASASPAAATACCARSTSKTGKVLWTLRHRRPIAAGPTIFSVGGKEYVAITVGGTPTSSNGGTASQLHGLRAPGAAPQRRGRSTVVHDARSSRAAAAARAPVGARPRAAARRRRRRRGSDRQGGAVTLVARGRRELQRSVATGRLLLGGKPVAARACRVDRYRSRRRPTRNGRFTATGRLTLARRHPVQRRRRARGATVGGKRADLGAAERAARGAAAASPSRTGSPT